MFAAHNRLANLIAIVDLNGQQAFGYTKDVMSLAPLDEKWRAFGWDVHEVDGRDVAKLQQTIDGLDTHQGAPHVLVANTVFGHGVSVSAAVGPAHHGHPTHQWRLTHNFRPQRGGTCCWRPGYRRSLY
jgi:transketolase